MPTEQKYIPFTDARPPGINHFCNCASYYHYPMEERRVAVIFEFGIRYGCVPYTVYTQHPEWRDGKLNPWPDLEWHAWEGGPLVNEYGPISL